MTIAQEFLPEKGLDHAGKEGFELAARCCLLRVGKTHTFPRWQRRWFSPPIASLPCKHLRSTRTTRNECATNDRNKSWAARVSKIATNDRKESWDVRVSKIVRPRILFGGEIYPHVLAGWFQVTGRTISWPTYDGSSIATNSLQNAYVRELVAPVECTPVAKHCAHALVEGDGGTIYEKSMGGVRTLCSDSRVHQRDIDECRTPLPRQIFLSAADGDVPDKGPPRPSIERQSNKHVSPSGWGSGVPDCGEWKRVQNLPAVQLYDMRYSFLGT